MSDAIQRDDAGRIGRAFSAAKAEGRAALVIYIMAGDPDLETTGALVEELERAGADVVELGLPFSDPIADGPVIQAAGQRALQNDISVRTILDFVGDLRSRCALPIVGMGYVNPLLAMGYETFVRYATERGLDGLIIPDLPPEEGEELLAASQLHGLDWVQLVAPTSRPERMRKLAELSRGFLYYVSRAGITGEQTELPPALVAEVGRVRDVSPLPVAVGFGISTPEQAGLVGGCADGVVIGSAVVRLVGESPDGASSVHRVGDFVRSVRNALAREQAETQADR